MTVSINENSDDIYGDMMDDNKIDFTYSGWGHAIERQWQMKGPMEDGREKVQGNCTPLPEVGTVILMNDSSEWIFDEVRHDNHVKDLFFGIIRKLGDKSDGK